MESIHATKHRAKISTIRRLVLLSILLSLVVIGLGAYTRLTHAGLGCPDWPTCYGLFNVPETPLQIATAEQAFPTSRVEPAKAWNEMIHRYFAGSLGVLIALIALLSVKLRFFNRSANHGFDSELDRRDNTSPIVLPLIILIVVTFQAALGMWTVTLKLMPVVVMGHLLGGFTTVCLLYVLYLRLGKRLKYASSAYGGDKPIFIKKQSTFYRRLGLLSILILAIQIALGGWTSSNYAALTCTELPICQGNWSSQLSFGKAFELIPRVEVPKGETNVGAVIPIKNYEFGHLDHSERLTIHVTHRIGAMLTALVLSSLILTLLIKITDPRLIRSVVVLTVLLISQISLGISNIWFALPLNIAVAHNVIAACLMLSLIRVNYQLRFINTSG